MDSDFERALKGELPALITPETLACITLATTDRPDPGTFDTERRLLVDRLYYDIKRGSLIPAHVETRDQFDSGVWAFNDRTSSATGETTRYLIDQRGATLYFKALNDPLANSLGFRGWRDASRAPEYAQALATIREAKEKKRHRMGAMISAAFENKDQDNSQPQFLDVVRERTSYSVEDVGVTIFTKSEIQKVNWGLPCEAPSVADILCRVPNWVKGAREAPGRPGRGQGSQSLWRVVDFALALGMEDGKKKWKAPVASLTRTIRKYFPGALPEWEERRVGLE